MAKQKIVWLITGLLVGLVGWASPVAGVDGGCCPPGAICIVESPPCGVCGDTAGFGGTDIPCKCGDRVITNTKLGGSDPVLKTKCPCNGLTVASGVTLTISGTIQANTDPETCDESFPAGIVLDPGANGVIITTGRIVGFEIGVRSDFDTGVTNSRFERLQIFDSVSWGMLLEGDGNTIEKNVIRRADAKAGIDLSGDRNVVCLNQVEDGGSFGIAITGDNNTVCRNDALRNAFFDGFTICGGRNTVDQNRSDWNGGFGIFDCPGPIANTYTRNRCTGNGAGPSSPLGLCK